MSKPVVVLDPGHGGYDPGAVAFGLKEKDLNLVLALKVAEKLDGIKVLLTRERDIYVSLADRVALSKRAEPDLFLSLHANAGGGRGFESFTYNGLGAKDPAVAMQKALHGEIMGALNRWEVTDRGLKRAAFYVLLRQNPCPAVLIESLFLDNEREARIWREQQFVEALAAGVAKGVRAALGLTGAGNTPMVESPPVAQPSAFENKPGNDSGGTLFTVQVGTFAYVENARQRLAEARKAGFTDAYIYQKQL
jgi:N-acetylmuramoyl-L-alanine amidase